MGITYVQGTVRGPTGKEAVVDFLVDSGATYSLLPGPVWRKLELEPKRRMSFRMADGTQLVRQVSECLFILAGEAGHAPVVLGEPGDGQALLGVVTLENLALVFNPFSRTLQPMRMLLV
ncbi:MAG: aspartyl protease [Dehalococcoidia bacterium]|nr:aspartyl protease [Dehalococcoidia bacterium]